MPDQENQQSVQVDRRSIRPRYTKQQREERARGMLPLSEWQKRFEEHSQFDVVAHYVRPIQLYKTQQGFDKSYSIRRKTALAWSEGVLIVQENRYVTVLLDRLHVQTFYYHDNHHHNLQPYLNRPLTVQVAAIIREGTHTYVVLTRRSVLSALYHKLIDDDKPFNATIVHFTDFGAFLKYQDLRLRVNNRDFSDTKGLLISDVYKLGDDILVKPKSHNDHKVELTVAPVQKFTYDQEKAWLPLKEGMEMVGTVKMWGPVSCYVRLRLGVDAICNYPHNFEIEKGQRVLFHIAKLDKAKHLLQGFIVRPVDNYSEEHDEERDDLQKALKRSNQYKFALGNLYDEWEEKLQAMQDAKTDSDSNLNRNKDMNTSSNELDNSEN